MSKFSDATFYLAPSGYKEGILFPQKPLSTNGEITFTRASSAWRTNIEGQVEETCYNLLQQSEDFSNTYWTKSNTTISIDTTTAPNGTLTADKLVENTANTDHRINSTFSATIGTSYTTSIYLKSGERTSVKLYSNIQGGVKSVIINLSNGTFSSSTLPNAPIITNVGDGWYRVSYVQTADISSPISVYVVLLNASNQESYTGDGTSGLFIWGAQLVQGSLPKPYLSTTNRQNFPRVDYSLGTGTFLLEPQRTNSIRNSTGVGAVVGSPGTIPTNWFSTNTGLTRTIVGTGVENGLSYIDLKFNGTATGTSVGVYIDNISLSGSQTWTLSAYVKLVSGVFNSSAIAWDEYNGGSYIGGKNQTISVTSTLDRYVLSATTAASCTNAYPTLYFYVTSGSSYDFTVRIAQPQMELGAYVTSPIFTTSSAVTRIADSFSRGNIFTNNLISASGGTWFVEFKNNLSLTGDGGGDWISLTDSGGTSGNGLRFYNPPSLSRMIIYKIISSAGTPLFTTTTDSVKVAIKWNGSTADVFVNGIKQVSATAFTFTAMQILSTGITAVPKFIQQMALWNTALTDTQCTDLTL